MTFLTRCGSIPVIMLRAPLFASCPSAHRTGDRVELGHEYSASRRRNLCQDGVGTANPFRINEQFERANAFFDEYTSAAADCAGACAASDVDRSSSLPVDLSACVFALDDACFSVFSAWKCVTKDQKCEKAVVLNGGKLELSVAAACFRKASTTAAWSSIDIFSRMVCGIVFSGTAPARLPSSARRVVPGLAVRRIEVIGPCSVALLSSFLRSWCWSCCRRRWRCVPG